MAKKPEITIQQITKRLLEHLGVQAKVEIAKSEEGLIRVRFETQEPGVLIGYHGQTLSAIQLLIALMVYRKTGEWARILVDVNDYREKREGVLERMALSVAQKVKFSGEAQALPPMSSFERRVIHLALASDPEVETTSEGEGQERRVVVRPGGGGPK